MRHNRAFELQTFQTVGKGGNFLSFCLQHQKGKQIQFKRLEAFVRDSWRKHRDDVRLRRMEQRPGQTAVPQEHKLAFVVRIVE